MKTRKHLKGHNLEREKKNFYLDLQLYFDFALLGIMFFLPKEFKRLAAYLDINHPTAYLVFILALIGILVVMVVYGFIKKEIARYVRIAFRVECVAIIIAWLVMKMIYDF
jgi:hypothetical protein